MLNNIIKELETERINEWGFGIVVNFNVKITLKPSAVCHGKPQSSFHTLELIFSKGTLKNHFIALTDWTFEMYCIHFDRMQVNHSYKPAQ